MTDCATERSKPAPDETATLDLATLREKLKSRKGRQFWRSLDELADTPGFQDLLHREFPREATLIPEGPSRRTFLKIMAASLAMTGLAACTDQPDEHIIPYVKQKEYTVPGRPDVYATTLLLAGYARGALVTSHMGRPTKVEGNRDHPASVGATDVWMQAAVLSLWDPARSQAVLNLNEISTWQAFVQNMAARWRQLSTGSAAGALRILTGRITSPSLRALIQGVINESPGARWIEYEAVGAKRAAGGAVYRFENAQRILSLDSDFLLGDAGSIRYANDFMAGRRARKGEQQTQDMNRLYVVESMPSVTGSAADHRFRRKPSEIAQLARDLASGNPGAPFDKVWADLQQHRGAAVVVAGESLPPEVQGLVRQLNESLGAVGTTVEYRDEADGDELNLAGLAELVAEMNADQVGTLVILGANPLYDAPADLDFASAFRRVSLRISHSYYVDETALYCHWHVPAVHELEMWGDALSHDGRASLMQPLIRPLYNGVSPYDFVQALRGAADRSAYEIVRAFWQERLGGEGFEAAWRKAVHDGVLPEGAATGLTVGSAMTQARPATQPATRDANVGSGGLELSLKPDPTLFDGRYANNAWLQECPKPLTTLVWGNAAFFSPATAQKHEIQNEDVVELEYRGRKIELPAWIMPGHANDTVTVYLGHGRPHGTDVGKNVGVNAYALRTSDAPWGGAGLNVRRAGATVKLSHTQSHHLLDRDYLEEEPNKNDGGFHGVDDRRGREIIGGEFTFEQFAAAAAAHAPGSGHDDHGHGGHGTPGNGHGDKSLPVLPQHPRDMSLYNPAPADYSDNYKWGMVIDLTACIGCNACVVGCQSENNIPTVGAEQVRRGREMHWIRIDRYYTGADLDEPEFVNQPMLCQQCENAPCEVVCPVNATVHSAEGLNDMVYNRCVGTRYCSNNCPYKVRRFNWLEYPSLNKDEPTLHLRSNPNVTIRNRGVMEKCTYCVQRISAGRIEAKKILADFPGASPDEQAAMQRKADEVINGIQTACQTACPTQAIVFGNLHDKTTLVAKLAEPQPHNFTVLGELNTRPRTTYLARVRNRNTEIPNDEVRSA